jgi:hypothetical protein
MEEELESLREKSTRASAVYDDLEAGESMSFGESLRALSPQQWFILAFLLFLDVIAFGFLLLVWTGRFTF